MTCQISHLEVRPKAHSVQTSITLKQCLKGICLLHITPNRRSYPGVLRFMSDLSFSDLEKSNLSVTLPVQGLFMWLLRVVHNVTSLYNIARISRFIVSGFFSHWDLWFDQSIDSSTCPCLSLKRLKLFIVCRETQTNLSTKRTRE